MNIPQVLFYVSGHGYGHSVRMAEVIRALRIVRPDARISVKTTAPAALFGGEGSDAIRVLKTDIDPGVIEDGLFKIHWKGSAEKLVEFVKSRAEITSVQAEWVRRNEIQLIVADIPFFAGDIAHSARVPCIGISNFLWDWIYEPILTGDSRSAELLRIIRDAYSKFHSVLRLPFSHPMNYARVTDVPLVTSLNDRTRSETIEKLGLRTDDHRPRVLISLRGGAPTTALLRIASSVRDVVFLQVGEVTQPYPANILPVAIGKTFTFPELVSVADVVVGKPGYGMMAACVAHRKRLLCLPRVGFREDEFLLKDAAKLIPVDVLPLSEFESGDWGQRLRVFLREPVPDIELDLGGAKVCAQFLVRQIESA